LEDQEEAEEMKKGEAGQNALFFLYSLVN